MSGGNHGTSLAVPPQSDHLQLLVKVARLYHEGGMRQPEIATRLNMSQSRVSRLLKEATQVGVVRVVVVDPPGSFTEVEEQVRDAYGLRDVVITGVTDDESGLLSALGAAGARYLESTMLPTDRVGLSSWSTSLLAVVDAMSPRSTRSAHSIVQLLGGVGDPQAQVSATRLAERLARVTGGEVSYCPAPGIVSSVAVRDSLLADPHIAAVRESWGHLTMALVGIGTVQPSPLLVSSGNTLSTTELAVLGTQGSVGDVCLNFFDVEGRRVDNDLHERTLGIDAATLKRIPRRVGIAGGRGKFPAIRGAIVGGWCDVLITDINTARALLAYEAETRTRRVG